MEKHFIDLKKFLQNTNFNILFIFGPSGCGKRCIAYQDVEANYNRLGNGLATMIEEARSSEGSGRAALNNARHAVMTADQDAFREALLKAGSVIGSLKDFDLSTRIERTGLIDVSLTDELGQLGRIDEDLRQKARQIAANAEPIAVPVFRPISKGEAVIRYFDRVIAAVFLALGIDIAPFLLAMLILAFAYEPLMRDIDPGDDDAHKDQATRIAADESSVIRAQFATTER